MQGCEGAAATCSGFRAQLPSAVYIGPHIYLQGPYTYIQVARARLMHEAMPFHIRSAPMPSAARAHWICHDHAHQIKLSELRSPEVHENRGLYRGLYDIWGIYIGLIYRGSIQRALYRVRDIGLVLGAQLL